MTTLPPNERQHSPPSLSGNIVAIVSGVVAVVLIVAVTAVIIIIAVIFVLRSCRAELKQRQDTIYYKVSYM